MVATMHRNGRFPEDALSAAQIYLDKGLCPIPLPTRSKDPGYPGWLQLRLTSKTRDKYFPAQEARNVGVLNGTPSHNVVDVDLDCPETVQIASQLLPTTGWIFGRKSSPRSHWVYQVDRSLNIAQEKHADLDGNVLLELRGSGGLTVYPPSLHRETGERITWDCFADPGKVSLLDLQSAVRELAAAVLLARHWPAKGQRDAAAMGLGGRLG